MHKVLAIDLGTQLGWALGDSEDKTTICLRAVCASGTISFKNGRYEGGGMRFLRFRRWLQEIHELQHINEVVFEEVRRHLSTDSAHVYGGFLSHLTSWCEESDIPYIGVPVQKIKIFATGKGNAKKDAVIESVKQRGFNPADDNEADALALLLCRLSGAV